MALTLRKNAIFELNIDDVDANGFGIGRTDGFAVFVDGALPGDRLRVRLLKTKPRYAYAKIEKILTPSPYRHGGAVCPVASRCGGCQLQHCDYPAQLAIKKRFVADALTRIGKLSDPVVLDTLGMDDPLGYRNKAQFPVGPGQVVGFYAPRSHRIVPVESCPIQHPAHEPLLTAMHEYMKRFNITPYDENTHTGLLRHIVLRISVGTGERMVVPVINGDKLPREAVLIDMLTAAGATTVSINTNRSQTNMVMGPHTRVIYGDGFIREQLGDIAYRLSATSFFQVNPLQTKVLYDTALAFADLTGAETVIDAHAGVGGIALYVARGARKVYGVEIMPEAVTDAMFNAKLNRIEHAEFFTGAAEEIIPALLSGKQTGAAVRPDVVFLDPPRKGCEDALLKMLITARIPKLVYVSCDPATLARDVKKLTDGGYRFSKTQPVDLFPMTGKVESVTALQYPSITLQ